MIQLRVNDIDRSFDGNPDMPLLWYLRDILGRREQSSDAALDCAVLVPCTKTARLFELVSRR